MLAIHTSEPRTVAGRFAPGQSGNPAGRPKGARNKTTLAAEALFEEHGAEVARRLIDLGLGGDGPSLRFLVGRLCPVRTDEPVTLDVAPGEERDFLAVHARTLRAVLDGEITPKEGLMIARILTAGAKLVQAQRALKKETKAARHVPRPLAGEGRDPARSDGEGEGSRGSAGAAAPTLTPTLSRQRERESAPVSHLYFRKASPPARPESAPVSHLYFGERPARAPVSDLYSSTALRSGVAKAA